VAQADILLQLDGVKGEAAYKDHEGEIEIASFQWGLRSTGSTGYAGSGGGSKPQITEIVLTKPIDKSSPILMGKAAKGAKIEKGKLFFRKAGGADALEYMVIEMENIYITSFTTSKSSGPDHIDSMTITFDKLKITYTAQSATGAKGSGPVQFTYDATDPKKP